MYSKVIHVYKIYRIQLIAYQFTNPMNLISMTKKMKSNEHMMKSNEHQIMNNHIINVHTYENKYNMSPVMNKDIMSKI